MSVRTGPAGAASWSVGELAQACGLSVRVLRHWEQLGLITSTRTAAGHRRYGPEQVTRVYRAVALRRTGLGLGRIAALLAEHDPAPATTLREHLAGLDEDLRRRSRLRDRLAAALAAFEPGNGIGGDTAGAELLMKVIQTMTMHDQYVHGYQPTENVRLHDQAGTLVDLLHGGTSYPPGARVLEAGCGVGAQTVALATRHPGARITAVDRSADSLAQASGRLAGTDTVRFVQADIYDLPHPGGALAAGTFDHVFVCFLLEHLADPGDALNRLGRMLSPGGTITVIEGDHGSAFFHPDSASARDAIAAQVSLQRLAGGDALIGRRLHPLLAGASYRDIAVAPRTVYVDAERPDLADGFIRKTFTAMIAGIRQPALAAGLLDANRFDAGITDLLRTAESDGSFHYTFFKATATK